MEHKVEVAKKILTIASDHDGQVYGGFVRDVIVPRINDPNCDVSFKDVDIWFRGKIAETHFICELVKNFNIQSESSPWNREIDYSNQDINFFRNQYRIYSKNEFLFYIDVITSDKLPVNDFYVNCITYKYTGKEFEKINDNHMTCSFKDKTAIMFEDYNPVEPLYYARINRIFFLKGWTVRCHGKHKKLSKYIKENKLKVTEGWFGSRYDYIPNILKIDNPILVVNTLKDNTSKLDIVDKDILMLIFNNGLNVLNEKFTNNVEDNDLKSIYKIGLEDYRTKIDDLLKKL